MTGPMRAIPEIPVMRCCHMAEHAQANAPRARPSSYSESGRYPAFYVPNSVTSFQGYGMR